MVEKYSSADFITKTTVNHDDTSPVTICGAKDGCCVIDVVVEVTETWDDSSKSFIVGDAGDPDGFCEDLGAALESTGYKNLDHDNWGAYLWHSAGSHTLTKVYATATNIIATFVGAGNGGSQGQCVVYVAHRILK